MMILVCFILIFIHKSYSSTECLKLETSVTQKVEHEGFHRELRWLIENTLSSKTSWINMKCQLLLRLQVNHGMFVNPDEVAELNNTGQLHLHIDGIVDIEVPAHEANEHVVYIFLNSSCIDRSAINLPFHLRYQRSQITGGYGKVLLKKPSILVWCPQSLNKVCGRGLKVEAPCNKSAHEICVWKNHSYQAHFDEVEMFVPVGNLDDYPLVSIVTLMLGCAGCIYILSVLSTTSL